VQLEGTVKRPVFVADLAPIWEPPLMSVKAYAEAQAAKSAANSTTGGSSNSSVTSKDGGALKTASSTPNSPKASLLDGVLGLAQKVCDVAASIPVLGAIPKAASQKIASIRSEVASSGPSSILKYAAAGLSMIASVPSHGWGVVLGKTAKVAAQTLHAHAEEQKARERHAMMDFLGKVWTSARGYGEVQSIHDFINYVKGVNQASVQAYSDIPSDIRERWYQRNVDHEFERALDDYYNNQEPVTDMDVFLQYKLNTGNHFRYSDRAFISPNYRDDMKGYTTEQKKYLIDFLNSIDDYRKEYGPHRESPFMKDLDETERIVFNAIKNSAYESAEATWERIRNFPNLDIRQMLMDNFQAKKDVADNIVNVVTDPDAAYEKAKNRSKQENAHLLVEAAFAFVIGRKGKRHSNDDGASPGGSHKKDDHSSEETNNGGSGGSRTRIVSSVDDLSDAARSKITTSQQATLNLHDRVYTHVTPDDLLGAEKELNGIPLLREDGSLVLREDGLPFNHMQEVSDSYRGLEKLKKSYERILKNPNLDSELRQLYTSKINEVNASMNKIEDIFAPFGGILPPK
ncbi:hypothetical protein E4V51_14040, partial [Paenibacillus sp. 28ISP30-2]|nr:hypothetical protein [Paenibacillus sp. 28ISP30-2]